MGTGKVSLGCRMRGMELAWECGEGAAGAVYSDSVVCKEGKGLGSDLQVPSSPHHSQEQGRNI